MSLEELGKKLEETGYPVAYNVFNTPQEMPFICYIVTGSNNTSADDRVYHKSDQVQVELYTKLKDKEAEGKVEKALSSFFWQKAEQYIDSERCYEIIYEIEV